VLLKRSMWGIDQAVSWRNTPIKLLAIWSRSQLRVAT
jgi:hypothetical protein